ncbi:uncharacterized protein LAESUDRAFT_724403 [Laetiporus sulphureus 93-53]|uniref:F-box domain-containing protein n=1 Tax=Laetiporus sulphureus 93-53 TaxID=1314785 RepID=A0A165EXH3_9APHY|nr:uncharacterized protein LAESUDRAFT_724403 [Laetiporus sulphureus 93-53]KZT07926.1 hypothetical protein LAESUDRAFT_724403 [Laetiporus sulphureus 93-53]
MDHHPSLPSPRLPTEICDYILDHLWDDHKTLKVCSLVTREWLPTTRKHLFDFVGIITKPQRVAFEDVILRSGDAVALCVRKLDLKWELGVSRSPPIPVSVARMIASLGRLEELTLRGTIWSDSHSPPKTTTWPVLPMVKALHLRISIVAAVVSLQRFICACPSLSSLELQIGRTSVSHRSHTHPPTVIPRSIVLETLQCSLDEPDPMLGWLLYGGLKLRMRRLAITVPDYPTSGNYLRTGDVQALLRASGECLEHLIVRVETEIFSSYSPDRQQAALAHNPNLVSIYVSSIWCGFSDDVPDDGPYSNGWLGLLTILVDIQSMHTKLQSIDITFITAFKPDFTSLSCEQLDAALARVMDTHPQLILTVWIRCDCDKPMPWLAEFAEALLQGLVRAQAGRGRLCLMWLNGYDEINELGRGMLPSWCSL